MSELEDLIAQQDREMKWGNFQPREPFVTMSLDMKIGESQESLGSVYIGSDGQMSDNWHTHDKDVSCAIHGKAELLVRPDDGRIQCRGCRRDQLTLRRRKAGVPARNFCPHGWPACTRVTPGGSRYCPECNKRSAKLYRERHRELLRQKTEARRLSAKYHTSGGNRT